MLQFGTRLDRRWARRCRSTTAVALAASLAVVGASCDSGDDGSAEAVAPPAAEPTPSTAASDAEAPPATTEPAADPTVPTTAAPAATSTPPTTESCGAFCPLDGEQQAATDAFFAAYNGDDWDALLDVLATDEPTWIMTPASTQSTELVRYDFIWSAAMNETWTPVECVDQYGTVSCSVAMEDDLHRLLAPYEMEPSVCQVSFEVIDGKVLPKRYDALLSGCHGMYDGAMHFFGAWFEGAYPDQPPIQGPHYRGWNQTDETAGARAASHLDEWAPVVAEQLGDGTVHDVTGHP